MAWPKGQARLLPLRLRRTVPPTRAPHQERPKEPDNHARSSASYVTTAELGDGIVQITLSRPDALNALNEQVLLELFEAARELASRETLRAVILTGEGRAFVAGADIKAMLEMSSDRAQAFRPSSGIAR